MAWYHFIPGIGLTILAAEKVAESVGNQAVNQYVNTNATQTDAVNAEIQAYVSGLPSNQQPSEWFKDSSGVWILKFLNGRTVDFTSYKGLSNQERAALAGVTTTFKNPNATGTGSQSLVENGSGTGTQNSFFTTTNIALGVGILAALGIVLFLIFRRNGRVTKRQ